MAIQTYQSHDLAYGALDMQSFAALDPDHVALACKRREQDVGAVCLENLADLVEAREENAVNLGRRDSDILHVQSNARNGLMELLLSQFNGLRAFSRDEDIRWVSAAGSRRAVTVHLRERRWEVDGGAGGRLDELYVLPVAAANELVNGQVELGGIDDSAELWFRSAS